ncbi:hypothetical protein Noda2021_08180 [Candidatus Dependentiae bacterium Noda2021]|nr:hypothetical protein Noda2021_08180 [Candidatus Dependentiae bacterium Noda2021]
MERNAPQKEPTPDENKSKKKAIKFLQRFNNLPPEIKSLVLEYVHYELFEPSIGKEGAYVQKKYLPAPDNTESYIPKPLTKYWKNVKHYRVKRFSWPDLNTGPTPIYYQNQLYICNAADKNSKNAQEICKKILGPNKLGILINPAKLRIGDTNNFYINHHYVPCFRQHSLAICVQGKEKTKFSLHPYNNQFFSYIRHSLKKTTLVSLFLYDNGTLAKPESFELPHEFHDLEYDFKHLDGYHLIGVSKKGVYQITLQKFPHNEMATSSNSAPTIVPILTTQDLARFELRELALPGRKPTCGNIERILQCQKNPDLLVAYCELLVAVLYNRKNNQILKTFTMQEPVFCQSPDIFKYSKNGCDTNDTMLVVTPKQEFLKKRLTTISAEIKKILEQSAKNKKGAIDLLRPLY